MRLFQRLDPIEWQELPEGHREELVIQISSTGAAVDGQMVEFYTKVKMRCSCEACCSNAAVELCLAVVGLCKQADIDPHDVLESVMAAVDEDENITRQ